MASKGNQTGKSTTPAKTTARQRSASLKSVGNQLDDLATKISALESTIADRPENNGDSWIDLVVKFSQSGFFFIIFGSVLLIAAFFVLSETHPTLTFVVVVLGAAVLLYGTGTQGTAKYSQSDSANAIKNEIWLAGGAGVLALVIAVGIVKYDTEIRGAFRHDQDIARLVLRGVNWQPSDFHIKLIFDGNEVPVVTKADRTVHAFVPIRKEGRYHYSVRAIKINSHEGNDHLDTESESELKYVTVEKKNLTIDATLSMPNIGNQPETVALIQSSEKADAAARNVIDIIPDIARPRGGSDTFESNDFLFN